jgi:protein SCO1/2
MKRMLLFFSLLLLAVGSFAVAPLPGDSVYQLPVKLTAQDGHQFALSARRGRVQIVSMFYTSCTVVCPLIIDTMQLTSHALDERSREGLDLLAVSFDPAHDDVAALDQYARRRGLHSPPWTLARTEPADVRKLAAVLGVRFREAGDGVFNHTSELILLDADGRVVARTTTMGRSDPGFVQAVRKALSPQAGSAS